MLNMEQDQDYLNIVNHILNNEEFNKIKTIEHHGITRYDHSVKVSYYSYKIAKFLRLDYKDVARGGLLHDFFLSEDDRNQKEKLISTFIHPKKAVEHTKKHFEISKKEYDIIKTHMFPINLALPKYAESWIVSLVDKGVAVSEFAEKFRYQFRYAMNVYLLILINVMR